jgi:primosomal protein N'
MFYCDDTTTRKQTILRTRDEAEATILLNAKNESFRHLTLNLHLARAYLTASDPGMSERTGQLWFQSTRRNGASPHKIVFDRRSAFTERQTEKGDVAGGRGQHVITN